MKVSVFLLYMSRAFSRIQRSNYHYFLIVSEFVTMMTSKWSRHRRVDSISSPFFTSASKNKKQLFKTFNFSRRKKILLSIYGRKKIIRKYSFISRNPMHFIFWSFFPCIVIAPPQVFVHLIYRLNLFLTKSPLFFLQILKVL